MGHFPKPCRVQSKTIPMQFYGEVGLRMGMTDTLLFWTYNVESSIVIENVMSTAFQAMKMAIKKKLQFLFNEYAHLFLRLSEYSKILGQSASSKRNCP